MDGLRGKSARCIKSKRSLALVFKTVVTMTVFVGLYFYFDFLEFPLRGDEPHFWQSALHFSKRIVPSVDDLRDYVDMNTPLPFYLFGQLEAALQLGPKGARLLNLTLAFLIVMLVASHDTKYAIGSAAFLMLFPYFLGTGLMLYTDMICTFFVLVGVIMFLRDRIWVSSLSFALAIWSRQYALAFPLAICLYEFSRYRPIVDGFSEKKLILTLVTMTLAVGTFIPLVVIWGGLAPPDSIVAAGVDASLLRLFPDHPLYFMTCIGFYFVLPEAILNKGAELRNHRAQEFFFVGTILAIAFFLFPPIANVQYSVAEMGFLDKLARYVFADGMRMAVFYSLAVVTGVRFLNGSVASFMFWSNVAIMLKAPLGWDKYALPLICCLWYLRASDVIQLTLPAVDRCRHKRAVL